MRLVLVESPFAYASDDPFLRRIGLLRNMTYCRLAIRDCFRRGEAGYASHLLYTQPNILDDDIPEERQLGIEAGLAWGMKAAASVPYVDLGVSRGMTLGLERAREVGREVLKERSIKGWENASSEDPEETLLRNKIITSDDLGLIREGQIGPFGLSASRA